MMNLDQYLIALESSTDNNVIKSIIKKYPIQYPKELMEYKFDAKGNFDKNIKNTLDQFFMNSSWENRLNKIIKEVLTSPLYSEKIKELCTKYEYKIESFACELVDTYFYANQKDMTNNNFDIYITFSNIDRYDCPGFNKVMKPILSSIIKLDMGNAWIVSTGEYPTDFTIYRHLSNAETKARQQLLEPLINKQNSKINGYLEKFNSRSLKDQAIEISKYYTEHDAYLYQGVGREDKLEKALKKCESTKLESGEKLFEFEYTIPKDKYSNTSHPIKTKCYAISDESTNYSKLKKVLFIKYFKSCTLTPEKYIIDRYNIKL